MILLIFFSLFSLGCCVKQHYQQEYYRVLTPNPASTCNFKTCSRAVYYASFNYTGSGTTMPDVPSCETIYTCNGRQFPLNGCDDFVYYLLYVESKEIWERNKGSDEVFLVYKEVILENGNDGGGLMTINQRLKTASPPLPIEGLIDTDYRRENARFPENCLESSTRAVGGLYMYQNFQHLDEDDVSEWKYCIMIDGQYTCDYNDKPNKAVQEAQLSIWNEEKFNYVSGYLRVLYFTSLPEINRIHFYGTDGAGWLAIETRITGVLPTNWKDHVAKTSLRSIKQWKEACTCVNEQRKIRADVDTVATCSNWNLPTYFEIYWVYANLRFCSKQEYWDSIPDDINT